MPRKKNQISKMSLSEFGDTGEALVAARLGRLKKYGDVSLLLRVFYAAKWEPSGISVLGRVKECVSLLEGFVYSALHEGDADFFQALAELIPISRPGDSVSRIDHELIQLKLFRDPVDFRNFMERERGDAAIDKKVRAESEELHHQLVERFPDWPATIPETHKFFADRVPGFEGDRGKEKQQTIRDAAKRLGFPYREGKLGAPKREK
jgi:hypothetical protein